MNSSARELWASLIAILGITVCYVFIVVMIGSIPAASDFFGHSLGILGFILMLITETLYSLRKRSRRANWGKMSSWLQFHIFTGLVGPYLVLLHTAWKFNGLAGVVLLLTGVTVISGFIGRYIYTAVPRTADGVAIEAGQLEQQIATLGAQLDKWLRAHPQAVSIQRQLRLRPQAVGSEWQQFFFAPISSWGQQLRWWQYRHQLDAEHRQQADVLLSLLKRQQKLQRQVRSLAITRRMLSVWHTIHIPIGVALFTTAFIHITAAIYYATLLH